MRRKEYFLLISVFVTAIFLVCTSPGFSENNSDWSLGLEVVGEENADNLIVGMSENPENTPHPPPSPSSSYVDWYIDSGGMTYYRSIVKPSDNYTWKIGLESSSRQEVTFDWQALETNVPGELSLYLEVKGKRIDLGEIENYGPLSIGEGYHELEIFATSGALGSVETLEASEISENSAVLNMSYRFPETTNGEVRFLWRKEDGSWNFTDWVQKSGSGDHSEKVVGLMGGKNYEFKAQAEVDDNRFEGTILSFTTPQENDLPPIAEAGGPYYVDESENVTLDGSGSFDPENSSLTYSWSVGGEPGVEASLIRSDTQDPVFVAPEVEETLDLNLTLKVEDSMGKWGQDNAVITVRDLNNENSSENVENRSENMVDLTPEEIAEKINESDLTSAVEIVEKTSRSKVAAVIDVADRRNFLDRVAVVLLNMNSREVSSIRHSLNSALAADLTELMANRDLSQVAEIVDSGIKSDLKFEARIIEKVQQGIAENLIIEICRLPDTPESAAKLLSAMSVDKSFELIKSLSERSGLDFLDELFSNLSEVVLNEVYRKLSYEKRSSVYSLLSSEARSDLSEDLKPRFITENLSIGSDTVLKGENVLISLDLANKGGTPSDYLLEPLVNGQVLDNRVVFLNPGESEKIRFYVVFEDPGLYNVRIGDLKASFEVESEGGSPIGIIHVVIISVVAVFSLVLFLLWYREFGGRRRGGI